MKKAFKDGDMKLPVKMWLDEVEPGALKQIIHLSNLPFAFKHIAIMPDCHQGYGMCIGGVLATQKVVISNAVGVDIGCGMTSIETPWKREEIPIDILKKIMQGIREIIPLGFNHHKTKQDKNLIPSRTSEGFEYMNEDVLCAKYKIIWQEYESALTQIGTLGGGNHFIEIQKENIICPKCNGNPIEMNSSLIEPNICPKCKGRRIIDGNIWIMIHSGSRNLGYKVANHYNNLAKDLNGKWFAYVPKEWELAFLPLDSEEGQNYLKEMQYCVDFALANRKLMLERIAEIFNNVMNYKKIDLSGMINIAHNYARMENHFGENVMVHRKGATSAKKDEIGIIPGSQGSKSYIVKGLGNPESFMSCSHGAGRKMGRKEACRQLNLQEEIKKLDEQGIIHGIRNQNDLEEATGAYKDIDEVIENQKDLVEIITELIPIAVIKG